MKIFVYCVLPGFKYNQSVAHKFDEWVTKMSLFQGEFSNRFEGASGGSLLGDGWKMVWGKELPP